MPINIKPRLVLSSTSLSHETIRQFRDGVVALLDKRQVDAEQQENLKLVISEYFTNVIKHSPAAKRLSVLYNDNPPLLILEDDGNAIAHMLDKAPEVNALTYNGEIHESGMGLALIKNLAPEATYQTLEGEEGPRNQFLIPISVRRQKKIVIIDDDITQLSLLEAYLEDLYEVTLFSDPTQALFELPKISCDLIICDVKMPEMDGLKLREKVLAISALRLVPFIFLSGSKEEELMFNAAHLSIDDFLSKPVNKKSLLNTVIRIIKRSQQIREGHEVALDEALTLSLWNSVPKNVGHYACDISYRVASRGGGDFVYQVKRENSVFLVIGDVMGHGEQAKFFSFAFCGYLQGMCASMLSDLSGAEILAALSKSMQTSEVLKNTLVTCQTIEIFNEGKIEIASAGHPPPLIFTKDDEIIEVEVGGMLPGLSENPVYQPTTLQLSEGDALLIYTDGLLETGLLGDKADVSDFAETLREHLLACKKTIGQVNASLLLDRLFEEHTVDLNDDVTLVSVFAD